MQSKKNYYKELKKLLNKSVANLTNVHVAAIIATDKGIFKGVNYEDPVLSLSICAERSAIFSAITAGMKKIYDIHVLSDIGKSAKLHMCGACRQVASGFATKTTKVHIYSLDGSKEVYTFDKYFPHRNEIENKKIFSKLK